MAHCPVYLSGINLDNRDGSTDHRPGIGGRRVVTGYRINFLSDKPKGADSYKDTSACIEVRWNDNEGRPEVFLQVPESWNVHVPEHVIGKMMLEKLASKAIEEIAVSIPPSVTGRGNTERKARQYRGVWIEPAAPNNSGLRWSAFIVGVGFLRADTLDEIKRLIRESRVK